MSLDIPATRQRFRQLGDLLVQLRPYWQIRTFELFEYPWHILNPALATRLESLNDAEIDALEAAPERLTQLLTGFISAAASLDRLSWVSAGSYRDHAYPARLHAHIPGRKWQQITAFAGALDDINTDSGLPFLDWCAGKGYLGRVLAWRYCQPVLCLEQQAEFCAAGAGFAEALQLPVTFYPVDVLQPAVTELLAPQQFVVALHACGELHQRLLQLAVNTQTTRLALAPCCYHLINETSYRQLSQCAQTTTQPLQLRRFDLRLATQELITGGRRTSRLRENEVNWRLGFDSLQRDLNGHTAYQPVPAARKSLFNQDFKAFCQWAAGRWRSNLPPGLDYEHYLQLGLQRRHLLRRLELVRHLFRRPLEIWLALDRCLYLAEHGYEVSLTTFCERRLTPRNLLIQGWYRG